VREKLEIISKVYLSLFWSSLTNIDPLGLAPVAVNLFDIIPYDTNIRGSGFEKHHGLMDIWASNNITNYSSKLAPTVVLTSGQHNATKSVFMKWKYEMFGDTRARVDWTTVTPNQMQDLTERMFDAAEVPQHVRREYYRALHANIYRCPL